MRIIGGKLKGRTIQPPAGYKARPTTDFAREGLFNILDSEYDFDGLAVLDLFGGTGAVSFEFASRGAGEVCCVEMLPLHASFIMEQARKFGMDKVVRVVRHNVFEFLDICHARYDIIFADPPYSINGLDTLPGAVMSRGLLHPGGYFILEHPDTYSFCDVPGFVKEKKYGNVHFSFFTTEKSSE